MGAEQTATITLETAPAQLTAHRRSLKPLTGIRFFAAFYVVIFHTRVGQTLFDHGRHAAGNFFLNGYLAVPLFFLLSGFILAYTYEGQIEKPGDHRRFWEARFARIWPVYAISLLMASIPSFKIPPPGVAFATIFMVQAWNPFDLGMAGAWNMVCWTLSVEAVFYLVFPWVQTWIEERTTRTQVLTVAVMLALCVGWNSTGHFLGSMEYGIARWIPLPIWHLPEFFTGVGIGNYFLRRLAAGGKLLSGNGLWTYASVAATVALLCLPTSHSLVVVTFAALLFGLAAERTALSRFLSTPLLLLGGGISYSIYLIQIVLKMWVQSITEHLHLQSEAVRFAITTVLLILVSLILFKTVEDPARKLLRGIFARMESAREARTQRRQLTT